MHLHELLTFEVDLCSCVELDVQKSNMKTRFAYGCLNSHEQVCLLLSEINQILSSVFYENNKLSLSMTIDYNSCFATVHYFYSFDNINYKIYYLILLWKRTSKSSLLGHIESKHKQFIDLKYLSDSFTSVIKSRKWILYQRHNVFP